MPDFLSLGDAELRVWSVQFDRTINNDPQAVGLTEERAAQFSLVQRAFSDSLRASTDPSKRTRPSIAQKNRTRSEMKPVARSLAKLINACETVTPDQRIALGLSVRKSGRPSGSMTSTTRPMAAPFFLVRATNGNRVSVLVRDADASHRASRPQGTEAAVILMCASEVPKANPKDWMMTIPNNRSKFDVTLPTNLPAGTRVWITARWLGRELHMGPCAPPIAVWTTGAMSLAA